MKSEHPFAALVRAIAHEHVDAAAHVLFIAQNGERVDAQLESGDDRWHIVFNTPDGKQIDDLQVFKRPPPFHGVPCGRAVILNGPSSVGKSTIIAALVARGPFPWVTFDEPHLGTVDPGYLIWRDRSPIVHQGFIDAIAAVARAGNYVAASAAGHDFHTFTGSFSDVTTVCVGLDCDLAELERREATRRNVRGGLAASSTDVHRGWDYDLWFDTSVDSVEVVVDAILEAVGTPPRRPAGDSPRLSRPHLSLVKNDEFDD